MATRLPLSGRQFEQKCRNMASRRGCTTLANPVVGKTPWGTNHCPDAVLTFAAGTVGRRRYGPRSIIVECKIQNVSGSAERKLFSEFATLRESLEQQPSQYAGAWLVVGGKGWTPKLIAHLQHFNNSRVLGPPTGPRVQVLTEAEYRALLNVLT